MLYDMSVLNFACAISIFFKERYKSIVRFIDQAVIDEKDNCYNRSTPYSMDVIINKSYSHFISSINILEVTLFQIMD